MKATFFLGMLLAVSSCSQKPSSTNQMTAARNVLAFYLVSQERPTSGTAKPSSPPLEPYPILSDPDFVAWDVTNHTFVITPAAAIRVGLQCGMRTRPFVLMAEGVPIYRGAFWTMVSSQSCSDPVIIADLAVQDCFMGLDNVPDDVWRMIGREDPARFDRVMMLAKVKPTTNVTLSIELGYPGLSKEALEKAEKLRSDLRVPAAVQKLFAGRIKKASG